MSERKRLVSDEDGHDYIIPADKRAEFDAWLYSDAAMDGGPPPEWATRLNMHPSNHTFTDWRADD